MKLSLSGDLKAVYDALAKFYVEHGRGPGVGELGRVAHVATAKASVLSCALEDLGLVLRVEVRKPSGYLAMEITPTKANPYDEEPTW